ncbi:hypothetical protein FACS189475_04890 [Betaproteobacteria bacterium]|nr:hypothetical protein FACS189475_04890 [Betaproteobacteria bacterium]
MMNENDVEDGSEKPTSFLKWFVNEWKWTVCVLPLMFALSIPWYLFYRPVEVTRGPWKVLDPGEPVDNPYNSTVIHEGIGATIEHGDLIQISVWWQDKEKKVPRSKKGDAWLWVGSRKAKSEMLGYRSEQQRENEAQFCSVSPRLAGIFIGKKTGAMIELTEGGVTLYQIPFGDARDEGICVVGFRDDKQTNIESTDIAIVEQVFKGQLKYRTPRLYDRTWFIRQSWLFNFKLVTEPREKWAKEGLYEGMSADGRRATFQLGPFGTGDSRMWRGGGFDLMFDWLDGERNKAPRNVQVE